MEKNIVCLYIENNKPLFSMKKFECKKCKFSLNDLDLLRVNLNNGYIRCTKCDSYYKLEYKLEYDLINSTKDDIKFLLIPVSKKTVMENILDCQYGEYTILEV